MSNHSFPDLMKQKRIIYVHGFASSAQSGTVQRLRETFPNTDIVAFDLPFNPFEAISLLYFGRCCPGAFVLANSRLSASPCLRKLGASVWTVPSCCFRRFCPGAGVYPQVPADVKRKNLCSLLKPNIQILSLVIPSNQIVETTRCTHRDYLGEASTEAGNTLPFFPGDGERQYWGSSRQVQNVECSSLTTST